MVRLLRGVRVMFWMSLPRNRREALSWAVKMRFRWHYWRQTRLIAPLWSRWANRYNAPLYVPASEGTYSQASAE